MKELTTKEVHIGMAGDDELAMIAGILEYGSMKAGIPSRPFVRLGKKRAQAAITKLVKAGLQEIVLGSKRPRALQDDIGSLGLSKMEQSFDKMRKPALSPVYARRKGNKKLLVNEHKLRDSLTFLIVPRR
jgi:phage gpG-like protein